MNAFYVVPGNPLTWCPQLSALHGLRHNPAVLGPSRRLCEVFGNSRWGAHSIPGDAEGRWIMDVTHAETLSEENLARIPGVVALPHVYSAEPVGANIAALLASWGAVVASDTMLQLLAKLRRAGWAGARAEVLA